MVDKAETSRMKYLIKAYLIFKDKATASELSEWLNTNFKWRTPITPYTVGGLLRLRQNVQGGVLDDLQKRNIGTQNSNPTYEYSLKKR